MLNLRFMSKVVVRVDFEQINLYLDSNNLRSKYQSNFVARIQQKRLYRKSFMLFFVIWTSRLP